MTTPITLPIPYARLVAPLTWSECRQITNAYQAACAARFPGQWVKPTDETLTHWAFAEAAEMALARAKLNTFGLFDPLVGDCLDAVTHVTKEKIDVMFVARQIDVEFLSQQALAAGENNVVHSMLSDFIDRAAFRLVAHDNLCRLKTATIAPDGKVTKSPDYDTSQVYRWIGEVIRLGDKT